MTLLTPPLENDTTPPPRPAFSITNHVSIPFDSSLAEDALFRLYRSLRPATTVSRGIPGRTAASVSGLATSDCECFAPPSCGLELWGLRSKTRQTANNRSKRGRCIGDPPIDHRRGSILRKLTVDVR